MSLSWSVLIPSPTQLAKLEAQFSRDSETVSSLTMELRDFTDSNASSSRDIDKLRTMVCVCVCALEASNSVEV